MGAVSSNVSGRNARMGGHNIPHIAHSILHMAHNILDIAHNTQHSSVQFIHTVEVAQMKQKLKSALSKDSCMSCTGCVPFAQIAEVVWVGCTYIQFLAQIKHAMCNAHVAHELQTEAVAHTTLFFFACTS